jgi:tetratricopeptide (TPR) repeat protein
MLETIRQYAQDKLQSADETMRVRGCHRDYFLSLTEEGEPHLRDSQQLLWLNRFELERDNILAALEWSQTMADTAKCLRFGSSLWWFWNVRGYWTEGRSHLANILALPSAASPTRERCQVLVGMAFLTLFQGDYSNASVLLQDSLTIGRAVDAKREIAYALHGLGFIAQYQGDYSNANALYLEGLELFRALDDRSGIASSLLNLGLLRIYQNDLAGAQPLLEASLTAFRAIEDKRNIAKVLGNLGLVAYYREDYAVARPLYEEALTMHREFRDELGIATQLDNLGYVAYHQKEYAHARVYLRESLTLFDKIKSKRSIADVLYGFAGLAAAEHDPLRAAHLFGAGEALYAALGAQVEVANRAEYDQGVTLARAQIDPTAFEQACAEGRQMTLEQAIDYALQ